MDSGDRTLPTHRIQPAGETASRPGDLRGRFDKLVLTRQLEIHGHNVKGIARALGLSRDTLRTMLDKAGLYARS